MRNVSAALLKHLLAPSVGEEQSAEVVESGMRQLGLRDGALSPADAALVLDSVSTHGGIVAIAARRAKLRLEVAGGETNAGVAPSTSAAKKGGAQSRKRDITVATLVQMLAPALGVEKADDLVRRALDDMGWRSDVLSEDVVERLMERLADEGGLVEVTARFVAARLMLRFTEPSLRKRG